MPHFHLAILAGAVLATLVTWLVLRARGKRAPGGATLGSKGVRVEETHSKDSASLAASEAARGTKIVSRFLVTQMVPRLKSSQPSQQEERYLWELMFRACSQLQGLAKLDHVVAFQLVVAGCRSLMEMAVDGLLVRNRQPVDAVERITAWEESAKLKHAEASLFRLHTPESPRRTEASQ